MPDPLAGYTPDWRKQRQAQPLDDPLASYSPDWRQQQVTPPPKTPASFDPEGPDYDYASAQAGGLTPDATGHWPSRVPETGLIVKGRGHETYDKTVAGETAAGMEIQPGPDGRYYSQPATRPFKEGVRPATPGESSSFGRGATQQTEGGIAAGGEALRAIGRALVRPPTPLEQQTRPFKEGLRPAMPVELAAPMPEPGPTRRAIAETMQQTGREIASGARERQAAIPTPTKGVWDVDATLGERLDAAAFGMGQLVGGTLPAMVGGAVGGVAAGPVGAFAGAAAPSYIQAQDEIRQALRGQGVDEDRADRIAAIGGIPVAALDAIMPGRVSGKAIAAGVKQQAESWALKRIAKELAENGVLEGVTEGMQSLISQTMVQAVTGKPVDLRQVAVESGMGAVGGVMFGAGGQVAATMRAGGQAGGAAPAGETMRPAASTQPTDTGAPLGAEATSAPSLGSRETMNEPPSTSQVPSRELAQASSPALPSVIEPPTGNIAAGTPPSKPTFPLEETPQGQRRLAAVKKHREQLGSVADVVDRTWRQPVRSADELYALAQRESPGFDKLLGELSDKVGGQTVLPGLKPRPSFDNKVGRKHGEADARGVQPHEIVGDVLRGSVIAPDFAGARQVVKELQGRGMVVELSDYFTNPTYAGYGGYHLQVRSPESGLMSEIQVTTPWHWQARRGLGGHDVYDMLEKTTRSTDLATVQSQVEYLRGIYSDAEEAALRGDKPNVYQNALHFNKEHQAWEIVPQGEFNSPEPPSGPVLADAGPDINEARRMLEDMETGKAQPAKTTTETEAVAPAAAPAIASVQEEPIAGPRGFGMPPIAAEMRAAGPKATQALRARISNVRFGPIVGDKGTILFDFDGKPHSAPEPREAMIGHGEEADRSIALRSLLDKTAMPTEGTVAPESAPAPTEPAPTTPSAGRMTTVKSGGKQYEIPERWLQGATAGGRTIQEATQDWINQENMANAVSSPASSPTARPESFSFIDSGYGDLGHASATRAQVEALVGTHGRIVPLGDNAFQVVVRKSAPKAVKAAIKDITQPSRMRLDAERQQDVGRLKEFQDKFLAEKGMTEDAVRALAPSQRTALANEFTVWRDKETGWQGTTEEATGAPPKPKKGRLSNERGFMLIPRLMRPRVKGTEQGDFAVQFDQFGLDPAAQQRLERQVADLKGQGEVAKKVVTWGEQQKVAKELGIEHVNQAWVNKTMDGTTLLAMRNLYRQSIEEQGNALKRLGEIQAGTVKADAGEEARLLRNVDTLEDEQRGLLKMFLPKASEMGRDLNALKILSTATLDPLAWHARASKIAGRVLTSEETTRINELLQHGDREALVRFVQDMAPPIKTFSFEAVNQLRRAGLLTGARTAARNFLSNTSESLLKGVDNPSAVVMDRLAEVLVAHASKGKVAASRTTALLSPVARMTASLKGAKKGVSEMGAVLRGEIQSGTDLGKLDMRPQQHMENRFLDAYTKFMFRLQAASDRPFRQAAVQESLRAQAEVLTLNIKDAAARATRIEELLNKPTDDMALQAVTDAEEAVFANPSVVGNALSGFAQGLRGAEARGGGLGVGAKAARHVMDFVIPFKKTPGAVLGRIVERTPLGYLSTIDGLAKLAKEASNGDVDFKRVQFLQREAAKSFGRATTGTLAIMTGMALAQAGKATGGWPSEDQKKASQWQQEGRTENSVFLDGKWRKLTGISPLGNLVALGAQMHQDLNNPNHTISDRIAGAGLGTARAFLDQSFMRGVQDLVEGVTNQSGKGATRLAKSAVGSFVPTAVADLTNVVDPRIRDPETVPEALKARIPGLSFEVPVKLDEFGHPQTMTRKEAVTRLADPFLSREPETTGNALKTELARLGVAVPTVSRDKNAAGEAETTDRHRERQTAIGAERERALTELFAMPTYRRMDDESKTDVVERVLKSVRRTVTERENEQRKLPTRWRSLILSEVEASARGSRRAEREAQGLPPVRSPRASRPSAPTRR